MPKTTSEVLVGVAQMFIAPDNTAQPADPTATPAVAYVDVGYTEENWEFAADVKTGAVEVAEEDDPIDIRTTGRETHLVGQAAQSTIENMQIALGGGTITSVVGPPAYKQFDGPAGGVALTRYTLLLRGQAPPVAGVAKPRELWVPHVIPVSNVKLAWRKAPAKGLIAMDFQIVKVSGSIPYRYRDAT